MTVAARGCDSIGLQRRVAAAKLRRHELISKRI